MAFPSVSDTLPKASVAAQGPAHTHDRLHTRSMTESTATAAPKRKTCPHCGSKLPDIPVSLCPYCASPLETEEDRKRLESVNASRIGRVREHADFTASMEWTPPESTDWHTGGRMAWWAMPTSVVAVVILIVGVLPPLGRGFDLGGIFLTIVATGLLALATYLFSQGRTLQKNSISRPLLRRPGLIVDRRSETKIRGWGGRTTYYFKIELEDGVVGEFRYPGLGAREEPYATNLPGVAYTRGEDLLLFRHIRV